MLAAAERGVYVKIYDTRCEGRAMLSRKIHDNGADVNVIGWNPIVSNLLASRGDDGEFLWSWLRGCVNSVWVGVVWFGVVTRSSSSVYLCARSTALL